MEKKISKKAKANLKILRIAIARGDSVKQTFKKPTFVYQVSGEFSMIIAASLKGWLNQDDVILESLISFRRAGADAIISYFALEVARLLKSKT